METSGGDPSRQRGTLLIDTHHYVASQPMFVLTGMEPAGGSAETRTHARTHAPRLTHTWHSQTTSPGASGASSPVTPDAVGELHEGEGEVQAEEEKQVPRGFIRQDRSGKSHMQREKASTRHRSPPNIAVISATSDSHTTHRAALGGLMTPG